MFPMFPRSGQSGDEEFFVSWEEFFGVWVGVGGVCLWVVFVSWGVWVSEFIVSWSVWVGVDWCTGPLFGLSLIGDEPTIIV